MLLQLPHDIRSLLHDHRLLGAPQLVNTLQQRREPRAAECVLRREVGAAKERLQVCTRQLTPSVALWFQREFDAAHGICGTNQPLIAKGSTPGKVCTWCQEDCHRPAATTTGRLHICHLCGKHHTCKIS